MQQAQGEKHSDFVDTSHHRTVMLSVLVTQNIESFTVAGRDERGCERSDEDNFLS